MSDVVRYEVRGPGAWMTIDRPDQRNALNPAVMNGLIEAVAQASKDEAVRVIVLTGAGDRAFSAGGDLGGFRGDASKVEQHEARGAMARLLVALQACGKPVIARVNGRCLAGGFGLALGCDLIVAADDVEFGTPEIDIGLWPYMITAVIQRNVPRKVALELMLTGRRMPATEASQWGIANRVVPRDQLDAAVQELVETLAAKSPLILRLGKESFYRAQDMSFDDALGYLHAMLTVNLESEDVIEGVTAFAQKRPPEWKGR
ncbi:MAG: enoyl-CoA hydratase/isomerase family protein [Actinobacteria bacterium]|nr:enoyl-CoA hydratase/isomerase family protein [Actinomycetota bacterium]